MYAPPFPRFSAWLASDFRLKKNSALSRVFVCSFWCGRLGGGGHSGGNPGVTSAEIRRGCVRSFSAGPRLGGGTRSRSAFLAASLATFTTRAVMFNIVLIFGRVMIVQYVKWVKVGVEGTLWHQARTTPEDDEYTSIESWLCCTMNGP